jgi:hypothetical protein
MNWRPLPLSNSRIATLYANGTSLLDLIILTRASAGRLKSILAAYDVPLRGRGCPKKPRDKLPAGLSWERRRAALAALGDPQD